MPSEQLLTAPADATLVDAVAATISVPRARPADSFVLHAPLELLARAALLPLVEPDGRPEARDRLTDLAAGFQAFSEGVDGPPPRAAFADTDDAIAALHGALTHGAVDDADAAATWLAERLDAGELAHALAGPVLPLLSGAAHGSIFLYHLPRVAPRSRDAARMLRSLIREVARHPGWELSWFHRVSGAVATRPDAAGELARRLRRPSSPGRPDNDFIYPMMSLTEGSGLAHDLLHDVVVGLPVTEARRGLLRTAALSMLQDDPAHAPYGWSHCLTMPQATLGVADACATPWHAVAVAATYVLGFRSIHGQVALDETWTPQRTDVVELASMFDAGPAVAAATAWHTPAADRPALRSRLATHAATHHDAHLVKHTLACLDAAHADPPAEALFLAAAAHLGGWWAVQEPGR